MSSLAPSHAMKATSFLLPVLPAFLLLLVHPVKAQTSLAEMDAAYDAAIARIEKPQVDLLAKYQEGLRALQERKRAAGDLEGRPRADPRDRDRRAGDQARV
jgi:hypothetical protein